MGRVKDGLRRLTKAPGVPQARHLAERSVTPYLRSELQQLRVDHALTVERLSALEQKVDGLLGSFDRLQGSVDAHMPTVLNAIASTNGTARLLTRDTEGLRVSLSDVRRDIEELATQTSTASEAIRWEIRPHLDTLSWLSQRVEAIPDEFRPHIDTVAWLIQRVETVRAEMMHELRYGQSPEAQIAVEPKIINAARLADAAIRLNLGAGHLAIDGFVNVDMRELPSIDVVASIDRLPFEPGTIAEIFSSHTLEHFPEEALRRKLLPYWIGLLRPGGTFRAIVPDLEAMTKAYANGETSFETLRAVTYGGQEYEGDFHFTGFTPESMSKLLVQSGLQQPEVIASGRPNGDCLEFEISAVKPSS